MLPIRQTVIVVVGLAFEARIAGGADTHVICSGNGRALAASIAEAISKDCRGLISFGVAGGLLPFLAPGACVVASEILSEAGGQKTDQNWSQDLLQAIPNAVTGKIFGVSAPVAHPEAKRALYAKSGALAVDMESHIVGCAAAKYDLPFAAIRVITDPADRALPWAALNAMRPNGTISIAAVSCSVMKQPFALLDLLQTALDARAARATLRHARKALGSVLARTDIVKRKGRT